MVNIRNLFISTLSVIGYTASMVVYQQKSGSLNLFFYFFLGFMMVFLIYKGLPIDNIKKKEAGK